MAKFNGKSIFWSLFSNGTQHDYYGDFDFVQDFDDSKSSDVETYDYQNSTYDSSFDSSFNGPESADSSDSSQSDYDPYAAFNHIIDRGQQSRLIQYFFCENQVNFHTTAMQL